MKELWLIIEDVLGGGNEKGFTLLETLTSLLIITMVGGSFLSFYAINNYKERKIENENKFYIKAYGLGQEILVHLYSEEDDDLIDLLTETKSLQDLDDMGYSFNLPEYDYISDWKITSQSSAGGVFRPYRILIEDGNENMLVFRYLQKGIWF